MRFSQVDPDDARRAARDILSGAEYSPPEESPVERAIDWVFDRLGDAINTLTGGGAGSVIGWVIVMGLVAGATWLLVKAMRVPGVASPFDSGDGLQFGTESHRSATVWLAEADLLAGAGDFRGAIRCRYQALVARVITWSVVEDVPGRTAGEYRDLLSDRLPAVRPEVIELTERFESVWYGGHDAGVDRYEQFVERCEHVEAVAVRPVVGA